MQRITFNEQVLHGKHSSWLKDLRRNDTGTPGKGAPVQEILRITLNLNRHIQATLTYAQHLVTGEVVFERVSL